MMKRSPGSYRSEKRNKELARRKKQEEKLKRRLARASDAASASRGDASSCSCPNPVPPGSQDASTP